MSTKLKYWIAGLAVIALGLILAKVISPHCSAQAVLQLVIFLAGVVIAMAGLAIILMGLKKQ